MAGYNATSTTSLAVVIGALSLDTQSALSFVAGERVTLVYATNATINMQGTILQYNPVTGTMIVNIDTISGVYGLQPVFNTQPWGETGGVFSPWNLSLLGAVTSTTVAVVPTITVRALNSQTWDPQYGQGTSNFLVDLPAVAQIVNSRMRMLEGEWFQNTSEGTPLFQSLLGQAITLQAVGLILCERILGSPYVTAINSFGVNASGRTFAFTASVQTAFGPLTVTNQTAAVAQT